MTIVPRPRPFSVATLIHGSEDIDAVRALIEAVAPDQSVSFLVLEPDEPADTGEDDAKRAAFRAALLGRTVLGNEVLTSSGRVEPNKIYFVRSSRIRGWYDGALQLSDVSSEQPVKWDTYFAAVSGDEGRRAAVIVFAGASDHPAASIATLRTVADGGGLALVQPTRGGSFDRVIASAARADAYVTTVATGELASVVLEHAEPLLAEARPRDTTQLYREIEALLPDLCEALLQATGHDFQHYKSSTLVRRTLRRLHLMRFESAEAYLQRVREDVEEARALFGDLLISVTSFFRDIDAFKALATIVLPRLFDGLKGERGARIWVAGCATGEEAYSLAMLVSEYADSHPGLPAVQIFATDLDEEALALARRGQYPSARLAHVSPERVARFFTRSGQQYKVTKALREMVLFSPHNVTTDPPFSNIDLISCRNLLIYLGEELHQRLIPLFHYALAPGGHLFLGPSESLTTHSDLFEPVDAKHRISRRLDTVKRVATWPASRQGPLRTARFPAAAAASDADVFRALQAALQTDFVPRAVVVTQEGEIVATSGSLEQYVSVAAGPFVNNVTRLVRDGLRVAVRAALREAVTLRKRVIHDGASLRDGDTVQRVMITAQPFAASADHEGLFLLVFQPAGRPISPSASPTPQHTEAANALIERLETDLAGTRDELSRAVQDLEAVNEELKSSNEELLSMNEELQSANEELESSKDELQVANEALGAANNDLENLLASTQIPTLFLDESGNVRRVTPAASAVYNLRPADVGRPLAHFTHFAEHMPPLPAAREVYATARAFEDEVRMRDGTCYLRRVHPYRTPDGQFAGIVVTYLDVTHRVEAELSLAQSEARFRQLAETIPQLAWMARPDGHIFWYNERWYAYTGTTRAEMDGWGWQAVHDPEVLPSVMERWRASIETGTSFDMTFPLRAIDGTYRPFLTRVNPFRDDRGDISLWFGTNTDVSEEYRRSEAIRRQQRELRTLTDNSPDVLTRFDRDGRHVFVNAAVERAMGRPAADFLGRTNRELGMPPELCTLWERSIRQVFETALEQTLEFRFDTPAGPRHYHGRLVPELGADGNVEYALGVTRDRTAEYEAELALQDANRRKDEFLATLAHELRNPLAPVRNSLELLAVVLPENETTTAVRGMMQRQVDHMTHLIDDLMDISRINLGKVELRRESVAPATVIAQASETVDAMIRASAQSLSVSLPSEELRIQADPTRLSQIIGNLLHNASKYSPPGGRITLATSVVGAELLVQVRDTGIGIPEAMLDRIFDMFTQVERSDSPTQGGLGIGLALVKRLVELHGGSVRARSGGPGLGSEFIVRLPLSSPAAAPAPSEIGDGSSPVVARRLHMLVIDDNQDAADSLAMLLTSMDHVVQVALTGTDGMQLLEASDIDVAIVDIGLPDTSGYEVARWVRSHERIRAITLIALTGWGSADHRRRSMEAGFDYHLTKPADLAQMRRILERIPATQPTPEALPS